MKSVVLLNYSSFSTNELQWLNVQRLVRFIHCKSVQVRTALFLYKP